MSPLVVQKLQSALRIGLGATILVSGGLHLADPNPASPETAVWVLVGEQSSTYAVVAVAETLLGAAIMLALLVRGCAAAWALGAVAVLSFALLHPAVPTHCGCLGGAKGLASNTLAQTTLSVSAVASAVYLAVFYRATLGDPTNSTVPSAESPRV